MSAITNLGKPHYKRPRRREGWHVHYFTDAKQRRWHFTYDAPIARAAKRAWFKRERQSLPPSPPYRWRTLQRFP